MRKNLAIVAATLLVTTFAIAAEVPVIPAAKPAEPSAPPPSPAAVPSEAKAETAKPEAAAATPAAPAEATPATTAQAPTPTKPKGIYEGMFTFDWKRLTKCQIVGPITNAMLTDPKNVCKKADKETGGPASCKVSDKSEYLIFKTLADCKVEYEEQVKAAP